MVLWRRARGGVASIGDPDGQVSAACQLERITRDPYRAADVEAAREVLDLLYVWADTSHIAELRRSARTVRRWEREVLAWHVTGASNGPTELATSCSGDRTRATLC